MRIFRGPGWSTRTSPAWVGAQWNLDAAGVFRPALVSESARAVFCRLSLTREYLGASFYSFLSIPLSTRRARAVLEELL